MWADRRGRWRERFRAAGKPAAALLLPLWLGLAGCGDGAVAEPDEGASRSLFAEPPEAVAVSGRVRVFPPAEAWLTGRGTSLTLPQGLSVAFDEPLQQALGDVGASLGMTPVSEEGGFAAASVPVRELVVGLGASLDPAASLETAGLTPGVTTLLYDSRHSGMNPRDPIEGAEVFALPRAWLQALETAVGAAAPGTHAPGAPSLRQAGFVVGQVLDAAGVPVAGARVALEPPELAEALHYPDASLQGAGGESTGEAGLFLLVHDGGDVRTFTFTLMGEDPAPPHRGVLAKGRGLLLRVQPPP